MRLQEMQIFNRAPFENLKLNFDSNITVLSGINGAGKTTIMSYVVDAFFEFAKKGFAFQFEGIENKFYRVSSGITVLDKSKHSFVYLRFVDDNENIDYIDIRDLSDESNYNQDVEISNPIAYATLKNKSDKSSVVKYFTITDKEKIRNLFESNLMTYFPAYRYEQPSYLNDPYAVSLSFKKDMGFTGYLTNPIEVTSNLPDIANWIMDIVLDSELYKTGAQRNWEHLNKIFSELLRSKVKVPVRLGIGPRQSGFTRIQIIEKISGRHLYPSIFNMSSGELALVSLFGEITRQADNIQHDFSSVSGVVLIDEIDKHLHIKLQKEVLPSLMKLFPNVQFVVTSHSPFFNLGLEQSADICYSIFDLDNNGLRCTPYNNDLFEEVYNMMVSENERFAKKYNLLFAETEKSQRPLIITEGKSDWKHLKSAIKKLGLDLPIDIYEYEDTMGDTTLMELLKQFNIASPSRKLIGMFDRDNEEICKKTVGDSGVEYIELYPNIYAFSIPMVNEDVYGKYTSIEHYYSKDDLLKVDSQGRRLFLGEEFYSTGIGKDAKYQTRISGIKNKVLINGVIDEKVYMVADDPEMQHSVALPKDDFAQLILDQDEYAADFDFSNFAKIFDVIKDICGIKDPIEV